jgi:hypothetical protein
MHAPPVVVPWRVAETRREEQERDAEKEGVLTAKEMAARKARLGKDADPEGQPMLERMRMMDTEFGVSPQRIEELVTAEMGIPAESPTRRMMAAYVWLLVDRKPEEAARAWGTSMSHVVAAGREIQDKIRSSVVEVADVKKVVARVFAEAKAAKTKTATEAVTDDGLED